MLRRILKTSFYSVTSRAFLTLTNLVIIYGVSHGLGEEKLGIYSISAFFYYLFAFFSSFELTTYFGKEVAHQRDGWEPLKKLPGEMATTFILGMGLAVASLIGLMLFYRQLEPGVLLISAASGLLLGLEKNLAGFLLGDEKMQHEFYSQLVAFFIVAIPVFLAVKIFDIMGIYLLRIAASLITITMRAWVITPVKHLDKKFISLEHYNWKEISYFSAAGLSYFIQHHIDLFILSFLISKEQEGAYFLALRIFLSFSLLAEMTSFALTPYISRVFRRKESRQFENFNEFYKKILAAAMLLGILAAIILFFSRYILVSIFTKENVDLVSTFLLYFSFLLFFRFVSYYTGNVLTATRYQQTRFYILVTSAILVIGLELFLGHFFSVEGIIYARIIMEVFIFTAYLVAIEKIRRHPQGWAEKEEN